jgi:hypothetical protein
MAKTMANIFTRVLRAMGEASVVAECKCGEKDQYTPCFISPGSILLHVLVRNHVMIYPLLQILLVHPNTCLAAVLHIILLFDHLFSFLVGHHDLNHQFPQPQSRNITLDSSYMSSNHFLVLFFLSGKDKSIEGRLMWSDPKMSKAAIKTPARDANWIDVS